MMTVSEIMSVNMLTLTGSANLAQAKSLMRSHRIRHIPIVEEGLLTGLVSLSDLLAAEESSLLTMNQNQRDSYAQNVRIEEFMQSNLVTIDENTTVYQAGLYLAKHKMGSLPVVSNGKLVGIITESDFVNVAINLLEMQQSQAPESSDW
jgi:CBS domain-containing protein